MSDNQAQIDFWNGEAGQRWVENDAHLERTLAPVTAALLEHAAPRAGERVIDVGCGCGNQTLALARRIGAGGQILGVDISAPMLALARQRFAALGDAVAATEFALADAATHGFDAGTFDLLFSRFGVMFFADPHAAFRNLGAAVRPGGRLTFACWQAPVLNAWISAPMRAIRAFVTPPPADPIAPGPFAFADAARVQEILAQAGFGGARLTSLEIPLCFAEGATLAIAAAALVQMGPLNALLLELDEATRARAMDAACEALAPFYEDGKLMMPSAIWLASATRD